MNQLLEMQTVERTYELRAPAPQPSPAKSAKQKLLLADDDAAIRQILVRLLQEEGYFVLTAANGVEALSLAEATKFDLIILDLNMPIKDGWSTFDQLVKKNPVLPIVVITARPNQLFPALASGVGALLEKPLDFVKLLDTVRNLLDEPEEHRQARVKGDGSVFRFIPSKTDVPGGKDF